MDEPRDRSEPVAPAERDDLLRSSLTESDDAIGFDRPWSPGLLVWVAFLGGLPAAGAMYALNFRRLGMPSAAPLTFAVAMVLFLVAQGYAASRITVAPTIDFDTRRLYRFGLQALAVLFALVVAAVQRKRFRLFEVSGGQGGALLKPGAIAVLTSWAVSFLYAIGIALFVRRPG